MPHPINHPVLSILVHKCLSSMCCLSIPSITSEVPSPSPCAPAIECLPFPFSHSTLHPSPRVIFPKTGSIMSSPCLQYSIAPECCQLPWWLSDKESVFNGEMQETRVQYLGWEDPLEEEMAIHSHILAWRIPMDREAWQATVQRVTKGQTWPSTQHWCSPVKSKLF